MVLMLKAGLSILLHVKVEENLVLVLKLKGAVTTPNQRVQRFQEVKKNSLMRYQQTFLIQMVFPDGDIVSGVLKKR